MGLIERAAYLKGLADGLELADQSDEGRVLREVISFLEESARAIDDLAEGYSVLANQVDDIDEDLSYVEDELYGDEDEEDDDECDCCDHEEDFFEIECPSCREKIYLDEDTAENEEVKCPACGAELSVSFEEDGE